MKTLEGIPQNYCQEIELHNSLKLFFLPSELSTIFLSAGETSPRTYTSAHAACQIAEAYNVQLELTNIFHFPSPSVLDATQLVCSRLALLMQAV